MAHKIPVDFSHRSLDGRTTPTAAEASAAGSVILVRGGMSLGSEGWELRASASRLRRQITLSVVATQVGLPAVQSGALEEFEYEATLQELPPGRYQLHVRHVYCLKGRQQAPLDVMPFRLQVTVE